MSAYGSADVGRRVAVVGAGPFGVVAVKNLAEEGFNVTAFERAAGGGGLWRAGTNTQWTSVLPNTVTNTSKFTGAMTDYPMPDSFPIHPTAMQIQEYFEGYTDAFDVTKHIRFSTEVMSVAYDKGAKKWQVTVRTTGSDEEQGETLKFDRLVIATGQFKTRLFPEIKGSEQFRGEILHSQEFKDPSKYQNKKVVVVGLGNTSADAISALIAAGAKSVTVSHRHKAVILPRYNKEGKCMEFTLTFRLLMLIYTLQKISKSLASSIIAGEFGKIQDASFPGLKNHKACADGRTLPAPHNVMPVVSDDLPYHFIEGRLQSVPGIAAVTGPKKLTFTDGTTAEDVDLILCCTGLKPDLGSTVPSEYDPYNASLSPQSYKNVPSKYVENNRVARLYQGFLSVQLPHQLAFLGNTITKRPNFQLNDLMTMALAQLWAGNHPIPAQAEVERNADETIDAFAKLVKKGDIKLTGIKGDFEYEKWLNDVAGTRLYEHLGNWTSLECWKMWWYDNKFYNLLTTGIVSTHMLRLFDNKTGRKAWPGARAAIIEANDLAKNWVVQTKKEI